jgi:hypothetical protein
MAFTKCKKKCVPTSKFQMVHQVIVKIKKKRPHFLFTQIYRGLMEIISCFTLFVKNKMTVNACKNQKFKMAPATPASDAAAAASPSSSRRLFIPPPPAAAAAAAAETFRACSAGPLADHFTRTSTHCNSFKVLKTEQQNDMAQSLGVEEANALVAIS